MKENKIKEWIIKSSEVLIEKFRELNDQTEISKCIRTGIVSGAAVGVTYIIFKNGGINYNDKLLIGCSKKSI